MYPDFWNQRFAAPDYVYGTAPNAYLAAQKGRLRAGMKALVPGDGEGRNGVWLARQGLDVLSVDFSAVGLQKAQALAVSYGVTLRTEECDLTTRTWEQEAFDLVVAIFVHLPPAVRQSVHRSFFCALKPGGLLILEAFSHKQLEYQKKYRSGGPPALELLYSAEMLRQDFLVVRRCSRAAAEIIELSEQEVELQEGTSHCGVAHVVRLLLRKPS